VFAIAFSKENGTFMVGGAVTLSVILLVNYFFAGFSSLTVTSRIGFAMARDKAFP
jgi:amino acid transporter